MATIYKRGSSWQARVRRGGVSLSAAFRTKAEATAWALQKEGQIIAERRGEIPDRSFGDLLDRYADEVTPKKRGADAELLRIKAIMRYDIAKVRLPEFDERAVAAWRDKRLTEVSTGTVVREWVTLSHACNVAVKEWKWLRSNPFSNAKKPEGGKARTRRPAGDEMEAMLLTLGYSNDEACVTMNSRVGAAALFAIETAMRAGEICSIRPEHIDFARRVVHVPKTKNDHPRDVPLSREAMRILRQLPAGHFDITPALLDALWRKAKGKACVDGLRFHDLRREALTRLAKKLPVLELAKVSGHRDLKILLNTYYAPDISSLADKLDLDETS